MPFSSRRRRQAVHENPSRFWVRFWIPVLVSLGLTPILFCLGFGLGSGLMSHSRNHSPLVILFPILFPYGMLIGILYPGNLASILLAIVQFPLYGIILGLANTKGKRTLVVLAFVLLAVHGLAIALCFSSGNPNKLLIH